MGTSEDQDGVSPPGRVESPRPDTEHQTLIDTLQDDQGDAD